MSAYSWSDSRKDRSQTQVPGWFLPVATSCAIFIIGATLTWFLLHSTEQAAIDLTERTLEERAIRSERAITGRLLACEAVLHAAAGYIDNAWPITSEQWHRFVRPLRQSFVGPGVQGFGFAAVLDRLRPGQLDASSVDRWVDPSSAGGGELRTVILFLEPQDVRNRRAMGFDMASEPRRRAAMEHARDAGTTAISARVTLVQEIDAKVQPGFLMYVPVYAQNRSTATVQERRRALIGYVYSPFRTVDFLNNVFEHRPENVQIEVYDGNRPSPAARLYGDALSAVDEGRTSVVRSFTVAGHEWTVQVTATPRLLQMNRRIPSWLIWIVGASSTTLLCGLAFAMAKSRQMLRERVVANQRLIEQQRDAAAMLENSLEAVIVIDEHDRILEWNKQAMSTFGWTKNEVLGQRLADIIVPERLRAAHVHAIEKFHSREHTVLGKRVDMPAIRRDGVELIVSLSIVCVERRGETIFFASLRDITARCQQEAEVRQLNETLEQRVSERTQELEQAHRQLQVAYRDLEAFTRSVSHDLRAPLRAIRGYAALVVQAHGSRLSPEILRDMDAITCTAQRMTVILDNLLKLASVSQGEIKAQEQSLDELVRQVVEELNPGPQFHIHVASEELGCVWGDPGLLALALRNLIGNAIKFAGTRPQPEIWIGASERGNERICFVRDNGVGFDKRYSARLFGAFQRLHSEREFEGTGLGLTIVKSVIEKHSGRVWAESNPGAGATFYFALPVCRAATESLKDVSHRAVFRNGRPTWHL